MYDICRIARGLRIVSWCVGARRLSSPFYTYLIRPDVQERVMPREKLLLLDGPIEESLCDDTINCDRAVRLGDVSQASLRAISKVSRNRLRKL